MDISKPFLGSLALAKRQEAWEWKGGEEDCHCFAAFLIMKREIPRPRGL